MDKIFEDVRRYRLVSMREYFSDRVVSYREREDTTINAIVIDDDPRDGSDGCFDEILAAAVLITYDEVISTVNSLSTLLECYANNNIEGFTTEVGKLLNVVVSETNNEIYDWYNNLEDDFVLDVSNCSMRPKDERSDVYHAIEVRRDETFMGVGIPATEFDVNVLLVRGTNEPEPFIIPYDTVLRLTEMAFNIINAIIDKRGLSSLMKELKAHLCF